MISILPSAGIGIFSSYNGAVQMDAHSINYHIHMSVFDMLLIPRSPPLSHIWTCDDKLLTSYQLFLPSESVFQAVVGNFSSVPGSTECDELLYTGHYVNPVLGTLTVACSSNKSHDSRNGSLTLIAQYGHIAVQLTKSSNTIFTAVPIEVQWKLTIGQFVITFSSITGSGSRRNYANISFSLITEDAVFARSMNLTDIRASVNADRQLTQNIPRAWLLVSLTATIMSYQIVTCT